MVQISSQNTNIYDYGDEAFTKAPSVKGLFDGLLFIAKLHRCKSKLKYP